MEFELKFQVPSDRRDAVAAALGRGAADSTRLQARYFDTPRRALARAQVALRLRKEGRRWVQTAKAAGGDAFARLEHEVTVNVRKDSARDPSLHDGEAVGERIRAALAATGETAADLAVRLETDIVRRHRVVEAGGAAIEIAFDEGVLRAGGRTAPVCEVEFELKRGSPSAVVEFAAGWCAEHGLWLDPLGKARAGERLGEGIFVAPARHADALPKTVDGTVQLLAAAIGSSLDQVLWNAREIAAEAAGDEHVHQLRVGLRRIRTVLRELDGLAELETLPHDVAPALTDVFRILGEHRDACTLVPRIAARLEEAGSPTRAWPPEVPAIGAAVRAPAFQAALLRMVAWQARAAQGDIGAATSLDDTRRLVAHRLRKLHRACFAEGAQFARLEEPARHAVRKRTKRLRYLAEAMRPLFRGRHLGRYVQSLEALQDALGTYQDTAAARASWRRQADVDPKAWFGVGWLRAREEELARACERACRASAKEAKPFWS